MRTVRCSGHLGGGGGVCPGEEGPVSVNGVSAQGGGVTSQHAMGHILLPDKILDTRL